MVTGPVTSPDTPPPAMADARRPAVWAGFGLLLLLVINLPAFLCMGPDVDISLYDVIARRLMRGDVYYRDLMETNLPGNGWIHQAVRGVVGWRAEALNAFDFLMLCGSVVLLLGWLPRSTPAWGRITVAGVLLAFYLSTSEWCHCQRDPWMLLPCLLALRCRVRPGPRPLALSFAEGVLWGVAVWIKPFVMVPAIACWLASARGERATAGAVRRLAIDLAGLLAGGLLAGAVGVGWMVATGACPSFLEVMFQWNPEYFAYSTVDGPWWHGPRAMARRLFPWLFVHVLALPLALSSVWRGAAGRPPVPVLPSAMYLAWLAQAMLLQHLFDYVHVPPVLLGLALVAAFAFGDDHPALRRPVLSLLLAGVVLSQLPLAAVRIPALKQCLTEGSTPRVRDRVGLLNRLDWPALDEVAGYLREQRAADGEVCCLSLPLISLYNDLDLQPSTKFLFLESCLYVHMSRRELIVDALAKSKQKYLVCDLGAGYVRMPAGDGAEWPPCCRADRLVFQSGQYAVFRVDAAEMPVWLQQRFTR